MLTKASESLVRTDIAETKEQIKLELMGNSNSEGKYTNSDVVNAVKKITGNDIEEEAESVTTAKGNVVDLIDLWRKEEKSITFTLCGRSVTLKESEYLCEEYWDSETESIVFGRIGIIRWLRENPGIPGIKWKGYPVAVMQESTLHARRRARLECIQERGISMRWHYGCV